MNRIQSYCDIFYCVLHICYFFINKFYSARLHLIDAFDDEYFFLKYLLLNPKKMYHGFHKNIRQYNLFDIKKMSHKHQIGILEWFLKDHVAVKMLCITGINYILNWYIIKFNLTKFNDNLQHYCFHCIFDQINELKWA